MHRILVIGQPLGPEKRIHTGVTSKQHGSNMWAAGAAAAVAISRHLRQLIATWQPPHGQGWRGLGGSRHPKPSHPSTRRLLWNQQHRHRKLGAREPSKRQSRRTNESDTLSTFATAPKRSLPTPDGLRNCNLMMNRQGRTRHSAQELAPRFGPTPTRSHVLLWPSPARHGWLSSCV